MRIFTSDEMREADRAAIDEWGIPGPVLMENAAMGVVEAVCHSYPESDRIVVFCGPGNNGGDGLAVARHLALRGFEPRVVLVGWSRNRSGDASLQHEICRRQGIPMLSAETAEEFRSLAPREIAGDLWIDAIFGTGLSRPAEGVFAEAVDWLASRLAPVVAIDLPSGLDASRGEEIGPAAAADLTVALGALKRAHLLRPAAERCGDVRVADLGMPEQVLADAPGRLHLLTGEELAAELLPVAPEDHKGRFGHCLLVAGGTGKAGAALLAARGALRGGAGLVTVGVAEPLATAVDTASLESMTLPLAADRAGSITLDAARQVAKASDGKTCIAIGPGLGTSGATGKAVRRILEEVDLPAVVDADGLNALAGRRDLLTARRAPTILTPHPGEASRLFDTPVDRIQASRLDFAAERASELGVILVLKGHQTLVAWPDGSVFLNSTGNAGMASGGSGDVLTGLIAALLCRDYDPGVAACLGVFLHGLAGDLALESRGVEGLLAGDILDRIPAAFEHLRTG